MWCEQAVKQARTRWCYDAVLYGWSDGFIPPHSTSSHRNCDDSQRRIKLLAASTRWFCSSCGLTSTQVDECCKIVLKLCSILISCHLVSLVTVYFNKSSGCWKKFGNIAYNLYVMGYRSLWINFESSQRIKKCMGAVSKLALVISERALVKKNAIKYLNINLSKSHLYI